MGKQGGLWAAGLALAIVGCGEIVVPEASDAGAPFGDAAATLRGLPCAAQGTFEGCSAAGCVAVAGIDVTEEMGNAELCWRDAEPAPSLELGQRFVACVEPGTAGRLEPGHLVDPADGHCLHFRSLLDGMPSWRDCAETLPLCP
jgi:hypothetical protein